MPAKLPAKMPAKPPQPKVEIVKIDADKAREYLSLNTCNRPLSVSRGKILSRKMRNNEWMLTGQAHIIVSSDNVLQNGQHTLWAVIDADAVIETLVVTGVEPGAFAKIDIGFRRSAGNVLSVEGAANTTALAAIVRLTSSYDSLELGQTQRGGWTMAITLDADEVLKLFLADPDNFSLATTFSKTVADIGRSTGLLIPPSIIGTFYYVAVRDGHDRDVVEDFCRRVAGDTGHTASDPALTLRRWFAQRQGRSQGSGMDRGLIVMSAFTKSFLAAERGTRLSKIHTWNREATSFPRL